MAEEREQPLFRAFIVKSPKIFFIHNELVCVWQEHVGIKRPEVEEQDIPCAMGFPSEKGSVQLF